VEHWNEESAARGAHIREYLFTSSINVEELLDISSSDPTLENI
jgi:hypothetical protein